MFVHLQHHHLPSAQVPHFIHLTEEPGTEVLRLKVIQSVEISEGSLESLT